MLSGPTLSKLMKSKLAAKSIKGKMITDFCEALSEGLVSSFKSMNKVITTDTGVMTKGSGKGKMIGIAPSVLKTMVVAKLKSKDIKGKEVNDLSDAVSQAVCSHILASNEVKTDSTGVSLGAGVGKVLGLVPSTMDKAIKSKLKNKSIKGKMIPNFCTAFSEAFCTHVMSMALVNVVISGSPAPLILGVPIPGVGVGSGKVS